MDTVAISPKEHEKLKEVEEVSHVAWNLWKNSQGATRTPAWRAEAQSLPRRVERELAAQQTPKKRRKVTPSRFS